MDSRQLDKQYAHLNAGQTYRVMQSFVDYDNDTYPEGTTLLFIGANFVPYDDGLSLFCEINGAEQQIRLQLRPEEQLHIVRSLEQYLQLLRD
ncbi:hypothetical protein [Shewanella sp.]|uniref:hypothetical protein n=1 Tax=Shewanella sp. TaxID=50422 RepID=UPI003A973322